MSMQGLVGIIGAGPAGLVSAKVLLDDGFDVVLITEDSSPGGVWSAAKIYPGLRLNNVHGEFRFSSLPMSPPTNHKATGGRLTGDDMRAYFEQFAQTFVQDKIIYRTRVKSVRRAAVGYVLQVLHLDSQKEDELHFDRLVLCSGGCSRSSIPHEVRDSMNQFKGLVFHAQNFGEQKDKLLEDTRHLDQSDDIVVIGGGKSAQDIATYLANQGVQSTMVFEKVNAFTATPKPLPDFVRKSRFLSVFSPHITLRTRLERFLHTTSIGSWLVHKYVGFLASSSFAACQIPADSPLRRTQSFFWSVRTDDEGVVSPDGFQAQVNKGTIKVIAPCRVARFGDDGNSVILNNGDRLPARAVVIATGYRSSWEELFDDETYNAIGLGRGTPSEYIKWDYKSLENPPRDRHPDSEQPESSIYRGIVPSKNIERRDFAINGAIFSANRGYSFELAAHWISSYFLNDTFLNVPGVEQARQVTKREQAWLRQRYPDQLLWANESDSASLSFFTWPQTCDQLLEDMSLPSMRSGGNWFNWVFKVVSVDEIKTVGQERKVLRERSRS